MKPYARENFYFICVYVSNAEIIFTSKEILQWRYNGIKDSLLDMSKYSDFVF